MSRFPTKFAAPLSLLALAGCMYPPMYQQGPYGQQMYGPQGNFAPSGTMVVPQTNAPPYELGGSTYSVPGTQVPLDNFEKSNSGKDSRYFDGTEKEEVPLPSDPGAGLGEGTGGRAFSNDLESQK
ncbi:MAG: hypothetical protein H7Z17_10700 [Fuerstia sp.]|nr:hypothetical protein [Fuerstiella sp.]